MVETNFGIFGTRKRSHHMSRRRLVTKVSLGPVGNSLSEILIVCNDYYSYA